MRALLRWTQGLPAEPEAYWPRMSSMAALMLSSAWARAWTGSAPSSKTDLSAVCMGAQ